MSKVVAGRFVSADFLGIFSSFFFSYFLFVVLGNRPNRFTMVYVLRYVESYMYLCITEWGYLLNVPLTIQR